MGYVATLVGYVATLVGYPKRYIELCARESLLTHDSSHVLIMRNSATLKKSVKYVVKNYCSIHWYQNLMGLISWDCPFKSCIYNLYRSEKHGKHIEEGRE